MANQELKKDTLVIVAATPEHEDAELIAIKLLQEEASMRRRLAWIRTFSVVGAAFLVVTVFAMVSGGCPHQRHAQRVTGSVVGGGPRHPPIHAVDNHHGHKHHHDHHDNKSGFSLKKWWKGMTHYHKHGHGQWHHHKHLQQGLYFEANGTLINMIPINTLINIDPTIVDPATIQLVWWKKDHSKKHEEGKMTVCNEPANEVTESDPVAVFGQECLDYQKDVDASARKNKKVSYKLVAVGKRINGSGGTYGKKREWGHESDKNSFRAMFPKDEFVHVWTKLKLVQE
ncbi:UNVERIFIED_CONTAM: hypothetical protein HDU68_012110 [Siphonaria sp. JEL0065]|nr:hypothetical protein HDU68_012110 [Siphonaria sp. JEL0065]